ncbi:unnamed protein product [Periconia digitata]|uniref:Ent-kaurene synthase n=1 Tax=Periconia digitata TaxID=1303443 RepID=A0A9W4XP38_9PLEO|nr:unnamed protein product [Periconia digitata]
MRVLSLADEARALLQRTLSDYDEHYGLGAMSCAAYDTAWVSLVTKNIDGSKQWLFPECFHHLLATQSDEGGWSPESGAQIDGILNTAGPLLALTRHAAALLENQQDTNEIKRRIEKATHSLRSQLAVWDVSTTNHVGFEIIVPAILDLLEKEDPSLVFQFKARDALLKIHNAKMSRFRPEALYGSKRLTALHSLESFIGKIDFDKVKHHLIRGSMMGSPSSTAAYLMYASDWNNESEDYLRHVIRYGAGQNSGGIPSAFPSTHFECTWVLSTLFRGGFTPSDLSGAELTKMTNILSNSFIKENGVLGFAPGFEADVDDTAKAISCLSVLGQNDSPEGMIQTFEVDTHFRTYVGERDPSCTANANALLAFLHHPDVLLYSKQVLKITKFLCNYWWASDGRIEDKWNICHLYPSVLLVQGLVDLLFLIEHDRLPGVFSAEMQSRIAITIFQACFRTLSDQHADGSWNQSLEETAYALLILNEARRLAFFETLQKPLNDAIARAVTFINSISDRSLDYIWIEKVSYASPLLRDAYVLAALRASASPPGLSTGRSVWSVAQMKQIDEYVKKRHESPLFRSLSYWEIDGSIVESVLFLPLLRAQSEIVFPPMYAKNTPNLGVLAFSWIIANNRQRTYAPNTFLYEMATSSILAFQLDEFMEAVANSPSFGGNDAIRQLIEDLCGKKSRAMDSESESLELMDVSESCSGSYVEITHKEVVRYLERFMNQFEDHSSVRYASAWDKDMLHQELRYGLLTHARQAYDKLRNNVKQALAGHTGEQRPTHFGNNIGSTYTFYFLCCILGASHTPGSGGEDCFPSGEEKYLANVMVRQMGTMCRMQSVLASEKRVDVERRSHCDSCREFNQQSAIADRKKAIFEVLDFEQESFGYSFSRLVHAAKGVAIERRNKEAERLASRRLKILEVFADQIEFYSYIQ